MYELLLTSVAIAGAYWGQFFLRKRPHGTTTFGWMQLASGALAMLGVWANHGGPAFGGIAGAIGLGMGTCLLLVGPAVRGLARRFAMAERLGIAKRLLDVAELLNPGAGIAEEKQLLGAMSEIRDGHIDQTIGALSAARSRESAEASRAIDERIAMLYLAAYRFEDAIEHAETHLIRDGEREPDPKSPSLRDALGLAPPVWVELMGAYGRVGNLDRAARMLGRLEEACADRPDSGVWVHRARMMYLALAGKPAAVQQLVARDRARHMSDAARSYWVAVAHERTGDREAASAAYAKARARSRGKPREMIDRAVEKLGDAKRAELSAEAAAAAAKAEAAPIPKTPEVARPSAPWAAPTLVVANLLVAAAITVFVGSTPDIGVLVRAGAMVRGIVADGEWWRVVSSVFIHVGAIHLTVNAIGLYFIGKLAEDVFGGARVVAIFAIAGVLGMCASYWGSPAEMTAGASGGIFGILGAVLGELTVRRSHYRQAWKRGVWGSLAIVTVAQIGVDFMYPIVDQWAHGAGLIAGAVVGIVLSPRAKFARLSLYAARSIAIVFAVASAIACVMVVQTSAADSFAREPRAMRQGNGWRVQVPASWQVDPSGVADADGLVVVEIGKKGVGASASATIAEWIAGEAGRARARDYDTLEAVPGGRVVTLPAGWEGSEMIATLTDPMDYKQKFRVVVCGRVFGGDVVLVTVYVPEGLVEDLGGYIGQTLATIGPA